MTRINGAYLKQFGRIITENQRQALVLVTETEGFFRLYYYIVIKCGDKFTNPYRIKASEYTYYYDKIRMNTKW